MNCKQILLEATQGERYIQEFKLFIKDTNGNRVPMDLSIYSRIDFMVKKNASSAHIIHASTFNNLTANISVVNNIIKLSINIPDVQKGYYIFDFDLTYVDENGDDAIVTPRELTGKLFIHEQITR